MLFYSLVESGDRIKISASTIMRVKVKLFIAGRIIEEIVEAANYDDAKQTALARNPTARVVSITAIF